MQGQPYPLVVIGAGTAGITAAQQALQLGVERVALIEKEPRLGGDCANYACVPTKTLLTAAKFIKSSRRYLREYGVETSPPQLDMAKLAKKVTQVIGDERLETPGLDLIRGQARFTDPHTLDVNGTSLSGDKIIIATGSEPIIPSIEGLEDAGYLTFKQASRLERLPQSMVIIGGGPVGVEFSQAFQWFGCQITLLEHGERLLSKEEPEMSQALQCALEQDGIAIHTGCEVVRIEKIHTGKKVFAKCNGQLQTFEAEALLLCIGMKPDLDALDLAKAGVKFDSHGIAVNSELRTACAHIWAVGDVVGPYRFTHIADYQAVTAAYNAIQNAGRTVDYHAIPWAIYTEPALAHVGYTEAEARKRYPEIRVATASAKQISRYRIESREEGFVKLIIDAQGQKLVGGHILATQAEELAHMLLLAICEQTPITRLRDLLYIFPSHSQLIQRALEQG